MADIGNINDELRIGKAIDSDLRQRIADFVADNYVEDSYALQPTPPAAAFYDASFGPSAPMYGAAPLPSYSEPPALRSTPAAPPPPLEKKSRFPHFGRRKRKESEEERVAGPVRSVDHGAPVVERRAAPSESEESYDFEALADESYAAVPSAAFRTGDGDLQSWLDRIDEPFSTTLLALIDARGFDDVEVYKKANMSRQLFSRIRSDAQYRPAKKTVLALGIALELNEDEMDDLLRRAGFALSYSDKRDVIVRYFLVHGIYDVMMVNEALYEFDQPLL